MDSESDKPTNVGSNDQLGGRCRKHPTRAGRAAPMDALARAAKRCSASMTATATTRASDAGACATNGETKMTTWADEYVTLLDDCEKRSEKLTDWELGFVDSLQRQLAEGRRPSAKQIDTLDTIWERATKRG